MVYTTDIRTLTATGTLSLNNDVYIVDATSGAITITLPNIVCNGIQYKMIRTDTTLNGVTVQGTGGQLIDGVATVSLLSLSILEVQSYSSAWYKIMNSSLSRSNSKALFTTAFVQNNGNAFIPFTAASSTSQLICSFSYVGGSVEPISKLLVVIAAGGGTPVGTISLTNLSGGTTVASIAVSSLSTTPTIFTSSTITNVPSAASVLELRIIFPTGGGADKVNFSSLVVQ